MSFTRLRVVVLAAAGILGVSVSSCSLVLKTNHTQCSIDSDCTSRGADWANYVCGPDNICAKPQDYCDTNSQCIDGNEGKAFQCRKDIHKCTPLLLAPNCFQLLATRPGVEDLRNDDVLIIGLEVSATGATETLGPPQLEGSELARSEFMKLGGGGLRMGSKSRPVVYVACDSTVDAPKVSHHLVDTVKVHAVLGPGNSGLFATVGPQIFQPAGVFAITGAAGGVQIGALNQASGGLLWRTIPSDSLQFAAIPPYVVQVEEPLVRSKYGLKATDNIKFAVAHTTDALGAAASTFLSQNLKFNGLSAVDNADNYKDVAYGDVQIDTDTAQKQAAAAAALAAFKPHIIFIGGRNEALPGITKAVELQWTETTYRPLYIYNSVIFAPTTGSFLDTTYTDATVKEELRLRMTGVTPSSPNQPQLAQYKIRHHAQFDNFVWQNLDPLPTTGKPPVSSGPTLQSSGFYDAAYVLLSALIATGKENPTGAEIGAAVAKLQPFTGSTQVDIGPDNLVTFSTTLASGKPVDLNGVLSNLSFDATNTITTNVAAYCIPKADATGKTGSPIEAYGFDPVSKMFTGTPPVNGVFAKCPL